MDDDAADVVRFGQADVLPCLAGVGRLVDPVAPIRGAGAVGFARPDVQDVWIGRRHGDIADGVDLFEVEDGGESLAVVDGLPQAARARRRVKSVGLLERHREIDEPAALAGRPDVAVRDRFERVLGHGLAEGVCQAEERNRRQRQGEDSQDVFSRYAHEFSF